MAKPNYNFEKRQREIAKKKQQDEKLAKKRAKNDTTTDDAGVSQSGGDADTATRIGPSGA